MEDFYDKSATEPTSTGEPKENVSVTPPKTMAYSVISLVLSLMSVVCCCTGIFSLIFAVVSIVFAIVSRKHLGYFDTMSIVGLVVAIVGAVFGLFMSGVWIFSFVNGEVSFGDYGVELPGFYV